MLRRGSRFLQIGGSKKTPHLPERKGRLVHIRMVEIDLHVEQRAVGSLGLDAWFEPPT
jgi:hypothetical protein